MGWLSETARSMFAQESVARDMLPAIRQHRIDNAIDMAFAESANTPLEKLRGFYRLVSLGITPPPFLMAYVAEHLEKFIKSEGKLTLDAAFGLQGKQKSGPVATELRKMKRGPLLYEMWVLRQQASQAGEKLSIENAAGKVIVRYGLSESEGSLKKSYIETKVDTVMGNAAKAFAESVQYLKGKTR